MSSSYSLELNVLIFTSSKRSILPFISLKNLSSFRNFSGNIPTGSSRTSSFLSTSQITTPTIFSFKNECHKCRYKIYEPVILTMSSARKLHPLAMMFLKSCSKAGILYPGGQRDRPAAQGSSGKKSVRRRSMTFWNFLKSPKFWR